MRCSITGFLGVSMMALAASHAQAQTSPTGGQTQPAAAEPNAAEDPAQPEANATDDTTDEIVVTGIRETQRSAIAAKRRNEGVTEVLNAEDIGQLPERNIADALQRLPGVTGNNDRGRSNTISLRGLGGAYTLMLMNGRQVASSFGSRSVNLDIYPSETVSRGVVNKTPSAEQIDGGIGGTVDLGTFRPLDLGDYAGVTLQGTYTPSAKHFRGENGLGYRGSAVISRSFGDGRFGVLLGYARLRETIIAERFSPGQWSTADFDADGVGGDFGFGVRDQATGEVIPAPLYIKQEPSVDRYRRDSGFAALQWKAADNLTFSADALVSSVKIDGDSPFLNFNFFCDATLTGTNRPGIGVGTFTSNSTCIEVYSGAQRSRDKTYNLGLNVDWDVSGFSVKGDIAYSRAPRRYSFPFVGITGFFSKDVTVDFTQDTIPSIIVGDVDLNDPAGQFLTTGASGIYANETALDELASARLDVTRDLGDGPLRAVRFGVRYADRDKRSSFNNQTFVAPAGGRVPLAPLVSEFPFRNLYSDYNSNVPRSWIYFDVYDAVAAFGPQPENVQDASDFGQSFDLSEETLAGYARLDFGADLGPVPLSGNIGVRVIRTDLRSNGFQVDYTVNPAGVITATSGAFVPVQRDNSYTNVLPSLNMTFALRDNLLLRAAAAIAIVRPDFFDLRGSTNISVGPVNPADPFVGSSGNPLLEPIKSKQFDLSLEWYPRKGTYLAVAPFYKKLDSLYEEGATNINPGGQTPIFLTQIVQNKEAGGDLFGVEVSGALELSFLPAPLQYLTLYGNYTKIDINLQRDYNPIAGIESNFLPFGMLEDTYSVGAFYDDGRLSASVNYYGQGESASRDGADLFIRRAFQLLSASVGFKITPNVTATLSGNNLLDERQDYGDIGIQQAGPNIRQLNRSTYSGRSFFGGLRFQF